jgi:general stress protein 26
MKSNFVSAEVVSTLVNNASGLVVSIDSDAQTYPQSIILMHNKRQGHWFYGETSLNLPRERTISGVIMDTSHQQGEGYALYFKGNLSTTKGKFRLKVTDTTVNGGVYDSSQSIWLDARQQTQLSQWSTSEQPAQRLDSRINSSQLMQAGLNIVRQSKYMILSTSNSLGRTHTSPVYFQQDHQMNLGWLSTEHAVHSQNIHRNGKISATMVDTEFPQIAVQFQGTATQYDSQNAEPVDWRQRHVEALCRNSLTLAGKEELFLSRESKRKPYVLRPEKAFLMVNGMPIAEYEPKVDGFRRYLSVSLS